jgi:hypothetical protein
LTSLEPSVWTLPPPTAASRGAVLVENAVAALLSEAARGVEALEWRLRLVD